MGQTDQAGLPDLSDEEWRQRVDLLYRYAQVGNAVNGVAHDLNNILGAIMAYAELIGLDVDLDEEPRRMMDELLGAVKRSSALVSNLTGIARKPKLNIATVNLVQLIERMVSIRNYDFASIGLQLKTDLCDPAPEIVGDRMSIELATVYLLSNALDSLRESGKGTATIRLTQDETNAHITVSDSNLPVADDVAAQMFDAFYTTRDDMHIGLGLNSAKQIAELHGGDVVYDSSIGFTLTLPRFGPLAEAVETGE